MLFLFWVCLEFSSRTASAEVAAFEASSLRSVKGTASAMETAPRAHDRRYHTAESGSVVHWFVMFAVSQLSAMRAAECFLMVFYPVNAVDDDV